MKRYTRPAWKSLLLLLFKFVDGDSKNWWNRGLNRRAGEWPGCIMDDVGSCFNGPKLKHLIRKFREEGKTIFNPWPWRFQYDPPCYELNFDDGNKKRWWLSGPGFVLVCRERWEVCRCTNPRKALKDIRHLQLFNPAKHRPMKIIMFCIF